MVVCNTLRPDGQVLCLQGVLNVTACTTAIPVRNSILFSTTAALLGPGGQANYAAANAAVNAFAASQHARGGPMTAVLWGAWAGGMAAQQRGVLSRLERLGMRAILPAAGLHALSNIVVAVQQLSQVRKFRL